MRWTLPILLSLGLVLPGLTGPVLAKSRTEDSIRDIHRALRARGLDPAEVILPFAITPEMAAWVQENLPRSGDKTWRLEQLLRRLSARDGLAVEYRTGFTATAEEVFASRTGNCLAFTNLFVGLAREMGIPAYFLEVKEVEQFERDGDLVVVSGHITAGFGKGPQRRILEFAVGPQVDYRFVEQVSDLTAMAMYYSNRGAELLRAGDVEGGVARLRTAVTLAPHFADAWVNLGVAARRTGDLAGAEEAYRKALEIDPEAVSAYQNLAALLRRQGKEQEALDLLALVDRIGTRNPYNYLSLGDLSLKQQRLAEAGRFYRKALHRMRDDAEPYAALGLWALATGNRHEAGRWLKKALKLDPANPRARLLERRLDQNQDRGEGGLLQASHRDDPPR